MRRTCRRGGAPTWSVAGGLLCGLGLLAATSAFPAGPPDAATVEIEIERFGFEEMTLEISVGTTVRWINRDPVPHTATSADGRWDSGLIQPGESYERTFDEAGVFDYYCDPHPFMKATVVVREGE